MIISRWFSLLVILILPINMGYAQKNDRVIHVNPCSPTSVNKWRTNLYLYGTWSSNKYGNLWTANNNTGKEQRNSHYNLAELGLGVDFYKDRGFFFEGNLGYSYGSLSYTRRLFPTSDVKTHWITMDANISHTFLLDGMFYGGVKSNIFVGSSTNNTDYYTLEGFYDDCFNRATVIPYFGVRLRFQFIKLDFRIGGQAIPYLNANKIAFHNMYKTHVEGLYYELRLAIKLFSTSNPTKPVNSLFSD